MTELLQLCDVVRDDTLPELGVRLEDHEGDWAENFPFLQLCLHVVHFSVFYQVYLNKWVIFLEL